MAAGCYAERNPKPSRGGGIRAARLIEAGRAISAGIGRASHLDPSSLLERVQFGALRSVERDGPPPRRRHHMRARLGSVPT